jgi:phenylacetate-coenzyme A ligase PaaK-like adenylate-forming protein
LCAKRDKRAILPRDLWPTKAIIVGGVDTDIYRADIIRYWGSAPYEFYVCAEGFFMAVQSWNRKGMVFLPDTVFFEFIPYEQLDHPEDEDYKPSTVLLNELEEGRLYEVVITQFYGMPLLRYRMHDVIKVIALRDDKTQVNLPHIVIQRRVGETIDLAGLARLDEKTIWQAIASSGIKYTEWSACKEYAQNKSFLYLYLELKEQKEATEVATMIDKQLRIVDTDYKDIDSYLDLQPVRVRLLTPGTFERYRDDKVKEGADLAHLKPAHVNAPDAVIQRLLQLSEVGRANGESSQ